MSRNNSMERRKHKRYNVEENVLVFNATTFGQIINICKGGLAFRYLANKNDPPLTSFELGLMNGNNGFLLDNIHCRTVTVTDSPPVHPSSSTIIRRTGVCFTNLTIKQQESLDNFLMNNTIGEETSASTH